ncbi:MAG: hypothetical protein J7L83_01790 [Thaumarchaeota archaeon]|nr:hypothetical protein [Nitrososphaerota archaeon]
MKFVERSCRYFSKPGPENTEAVLEAVIKRVSEGDLKTVVVASTSGKTGLKFVDALRGKAKVVVISHERMRANLKEKIIDLGGMAEDETHLPLHRRGMEKIRNTLYTLGQGFKVAVEVILIAADKGIIRLREDVVGVGGTGTGADTAIVARSSSTREMLGSDPKKRLEIREIIAIPLKKKWWE